jgi:regulator of sirC expression with transglutaminase-like and TPR domain
MQKPCEAATVYDQLLQLTTDPSPALFIDASSAWHTCSGHQADSRGMEVLLEGISRLGSILVLQKELVNQYLQSGDYPLALEMQNQIVEIAAQKTKPLMTRAAIHVSMGMKQLAREDLKLALLALDELPTYRKGTPAMKALRENILSLLEDLQQ